MEITKLPAKVLKHKVDLVEINAIKSGDFAKLLADMKSAMKGHNGIGLAANQLGHNLAIFVIDAVLAKDHQVPEVYFNPEITEYSKDSDQLEEGCLSIPEFFVPIKRAKKIKIKFINEEGQKIKFKARGFLARVLQHETDHLNGITIKDRVKK